MMAPGDDGRQHAGQPVTRPSVHWAAVSVAERVVGPRGLVKPAAVEPFWTNAAV
jgi:hypothetical protein